MYDIRDNQVFLNDPTLFEIHKKLDEFIEEQFIYNEVLSFLYYQSALLLKSLYSTNIEKGLKDHYITVIIDEISFIEEQLQLSPDLVMRFINNICLIEKSVNKNLSNVLIKQVLRILNIKLI